MNYHYVHCISYYEGSNRTNNLLIHIENLKKIEEKKLLIINIRNDDNNKNRFDYLKKNYINLDVIILYSFNTGGTVSCLYDCYKYLELNSITYKFIGCFEDDVIFKDKYFLEPVKKYLNEGNIFVGSLWGRDKDGVKNYIEEKPKKNRLVPWLKEKNIYPDKEYSNKLIDIKKYIWCEDPYITTYENLKKIECKFNSRFNLAPINEKYSHDEHGINYGEVGFPTRLSLNGFKFIGIDKNKFLIDL